LKNPYVKGAVAALTIDTIFGADILMSLGL
jgi:hypothetical protein